MSTKTEVVHASPVKRFFVEMLTRDIELGDAVLDLLDNCIDGIQRTVGPAKSSSPKAYEGFWAEISFDQKHFQILDNCGGMSAKLATEQAFMMGRPKGASAPRGRAIGMYGIGMKRSIFKLGRQANVHSQTGDEAFSVEITREWLENDTDWDLRLKRVKPSEREPGVRIVVKDLYPGIAASFSDESNFETDFIQKVARH